jgi:carbon monoxide dehydrogenase subunit G
MLDIVGGIHPGVDMREPAARTAWAASPPRKGRKVTMTAEKHTRSIHIDAPVEKVFRYIEDPAHVVGAMPEKAHATLGAVTRTPEGAVATYEVEYREFGRHLTAVFTREEDVANEHIVDLASTGVIHALSVEPDATGTTLTYSWDATRLMKMLDAVFFHGDKAVENGLATIKQEVEALP